MAPRDELNPEGIARAVSALPAALFVGDVSGPLNAEATALARQLDPKLEQIKVRECTIVLLLEVLWRRYIVIVVLKHEGQSRSVVCSSALYGVSRKRSGVDWNVSFEEARVVAAASLV